jgi:hypothetical protein
MALPTINIPKYKVKLPSVGEVTYRPYLVKEEKVLLMTLESGNIDDIILAVLETLKSCVISPKVNFDKLPFYEAEYLFMQIRSKSVGEMIELKVHHIDDVNSNGETCSHIETVYFDIETLVLPNGISKKDKVVKITDDVGLELKAPNLREYYNLLHTEDRTLRALGLILSSIDKIFDGDQVYDRYETPDEELVEFINNLTTKQCEPITNFYSKIENLKADLDYTCTKCGSKEKVHIEGVQSFFL